MLTQTSASTHTHTHIEETVPDCLSTRTTHDMQTCDLRTHTQNLKAWLCDIPDQPASMDTDGFCKLERLKVSMELAP